MSLISSYENAFGGKPNLKTISNTYKSVVERDAITIVITHPDNDRKKQYLLECIDSIKTEKVIVSNYPIDNDIQTKSDWILYTNKNEILLQEDFKKYSVEYWYNWRWPDGSITYMTAKKEAGYACYDLIRKGLSFCKGLGKKKIHVINYDYVIPNEVLIENEKLLDQNDLIFYRNGSYQIHIQDEYSTGFFSGDIDVLLEFFTHYKTKEQYYTEPRKTNRELFLEGKMKSFYDNNPHSIFTKTWQEVPDGTLIDREKFLPSREEFWEEKLKQDISKNNIV